MPPGGWFSMHGGTKYEDRRGGKGKLGGERVKVEKVIREGLLLGRGQEETKTARPKPA